MRFGIILPNNWGLEDPQDVLDVATRAEDLGFDSVWVNQHVFNVGFVFERLGTRPYYDPLTVLTYVASLTKRVRLGTSVLVLPYLQPMVLAKTLATLDVMSGGRTIAGVGVGGLRPEFDALGCDFSERGAYSDESIDVMKTLWTEEEPAFDGRFFHFSGVRFSPKPAQRPHPPIWIGGQSRAAMRRTALRADGWHPTGLTPDEMANRLDYLKAQVESAGRAMEEISLSARAELDVRDSPLGDKAGPMEGAPDELVEAIEAYAEIGVEEMVFSVGTPDPKRILSVMDAFASSVMPRVAA